MKKLPLDTSSFRRLREDDYVYVDKTQWIHKMITEGTAYFLSRPRRFGKSLTVSTLQELFKGHRELFKGLWIENQWDFNEHPVLTFDFNAIDNKNPEVFEKALHYRLLQYADSCDVRLGAEASIVSIFAELCLGAHRVTGNKLVILIDEYDKPIIDHLGRGEEHLHIAEENMSVQKRLFGVLKDVDVVNAVQFTFVTGVTRFAKVSIFSEWNNLNDLSQDSEYADFLGYTEQELIASLGAYVEIFCVTKGIDFEECLDQIRNWYNGYRFCPEKDLTVYNPVSILKCLDQKVFRNYWFSTGTTSFLVNLIKEKNYYIPDLDKSKVSSNFIENFDFSDLKLDGILYQGGYLTIKRQLSRRFVELGFPNLEVKESFNEILFSRIMCAGDDAFSRADELGEVLSSGQFELVSDYVNAVFASVPYNLYEGKVNEAYFHTIMYLTLSLVGYNARSEVLTARGRLDMEVEFPTRVYIFEFKCDSSAASALKQIKEKGYADKWQGSGKDIVIVGVDFDSEKRRVRQLIHENVSL